VIEYPQVQAPTRSKAPWARARRRNAVVMWSWRARWAAWRLCRPPRVWPPHPLDCRTAGQHCGGHNKPLAGATTAAFRPPSRGS